MNSFAMILVSIIAFTAPTLSFAESVFDDVQLGDDVEYVVRLQNGDVLSGSVVRFVSDAQEGEGIKLKTSIGTATIYANQIIDMYERRERYRHGHRIFVMPTAAPIGNDHFIGDFELLVLYGGVGIGDIVSITAGRSVIPTVQASDQFSVVNAKATLLQSASDNDLYGGISVAVGGNLAYLNADNPMSHIYGVATFTKKRTSFSAMIFTKTGGDNLSIVELGDIGDFSVPYANGSLGIGLGIDTKFTHRHDLHFIAEFWSVDIDKLTNVALLLGVRLGNESVSADFGFAVFTEPIAAPFASFSWTPF